jgi:glycosyltransferase
MTLSIITVSYNAANTIQDALSSVAAQLYPQIEHIVVDGGSIDGTMDRVDLYPHVAKKISERDGGIYHAMNKGLALTTGEVIGILNADDQYADCNVIQKVVKVFENPNIEAVYGNLGWMPPHPTFFVRKSIYEKYGCFDTRLKSAADYELMLRFLLKHRIRSQHIPHTLVHMRNGGRSTASLRNRLLSNKEDHEAWKMNELKPHFFTLILKPLRKLNQFFFNG